MSNGHDKLVGRNAFEAYLDNLCVQLRSISPARRDEIRREIRQHLEMLAASGEGDENQRARTALAKFGQPAIVGKALRRAEQHAIFRRNLRGRGILNFAVLLLSAGFACFLMLGLFQMFGWGHDWLLRLLVGPLPPLVLGWSWGMGRLVGRRQRWGYVLLTAIGLLAAAPFTMPGYLTHTDLITLRGQHFSGSLAGYGRLGHVLVWMWIACSTCGLASFFVEREKSETRAVAN